MKRIAVLFALAAAALGLLAGCAQSGPDDQLKEDVVNNYADGVHHL